jgi:hypothetical protein
MKVDQEPSWALRLGQARCETANRSKPIMGEPHRGSRTYASCFVPLKTHDLLSEWGLNQMKGRQCGMLFSELSPRRIGCSFLHGVLVRNMA